MAIYEKYYEKYNDLKFDLYGYSPPTDGTYMVDGKEFTTGEDYRTVERYKEYVDCGFNMILLGYTARYCGEEWEGCLTKTCMDRVYEAGLKKAIITDKRVWDLCDIKSADGIIGEGKRFADEEELDAYLKECIAPYKDHPAFYGVQLIDEPKRDQLVTIGQLYRSFKRIEDGIFVQCNLLPLCGVANCENFFPYEGDYIENWKKSLEIYLDETDAEYIMYDNYPIGEQFWESYLGRTWIRGLQVATKVCKERGVKLYFVAQTFGMSYRGVYTHTMPSEAQIRWQINLLMAFGVKQISYFTYWTKQVWNTNGEMFHDGQAMMTRDGKRTETWYQMQQIHKEMQKLAPVILNFDYVSDRYFLKVPFKSHPLYIGYTGRGKLDGVTATTDQDVVFVTELKDKTNGHTMYAIVNTNDPTYADLFETPQKTVLTFTRNYAKVAVFENGEWRTENLVNKQYVANLRPGYAQFILPY